MLQQRISTMKVFSDVKEIMLVMPLWGQLVVAVILRIFSLISLYGRLNIEFGEKCFSRISKNRIRTDILHIINYTVFPLIVTIGYYITLHDIYAK